MYCPHCGRSDQEPDAYCKGCGKYLYKHALVPSDSPADKAAWLAVFSVVTIVVCLIGEIYPESKLSSNPAFISIIVLQLFSLFVAYTLRRRLRRKRRSESSLPAQYDTIQMLEPKHDPLFVENELSNETTKLLDEVSEQRSEHR